MAELYKAPTTVDTQTQPHDRPQETEYGHTPEITVEPDTGGVGTDSPTRFDEESGTDGADSGFDSEPDVVVSRSDDGYMRSSSRTGRSSGVHSGNRAGSRGKVSTVSGRGAGERRHRATTEGTGIHSGERSIGSPTLESLPGLSTVDAESLSRILGDIERGGALAVSDVHKLSRISTSLVNGLDSSTPGYDGIVSSQRRLQGIVSRIQEKQGSVSGAKEMQGRNADSRSRGTTAGERVSGGLAPVWLRLISAALVGAGGIGIGSELYNSMMSTTSSLPQVAQVNGAIPQVSMPVVEAGELQLDTTAYTPRQLWITLVVLGAGLLGVQTLLARRNKKGYPGIQIVGTGGGVSNADRRGRSGHRNEGEARQRTNEVSLIEEMRDMIEQELSSLTNQVTKLLQSGALQPAYGAATATQTHMSIQGTGGETPTSAGGERRGAGAGESGGVGANDNSGNDAGGNIPRGPKGPRRPGGEMSPEDWGERRWKELKNRLGQEDAMFSPEEWGYIINHPEFLPQSISDIAKWNTTLATPYTPTETQLDAVINKVLANCNNQPELYKGISESQWTSFLQSLYDTSTTIFHQKLVEAAPHISIAFAQAILPLPVFSVYINRLCEGIQSVTKDEETVYTFITSIPQHRDPSEELITLDNTRFQFALYNGYIQNGSTTDENLCRITEELFRINDEDEVFIPSELEYSRPTQYATYLLTQVLTHPNIPTEQQERIQQWLQLNPSREIELLTKEEQRVKFIQLLEHLGYERGAEIYGNNDTSMLFDILYSATLYRDNLFEGDNIRTIIDELLINWIMPLNEVDEEYIDCGNVDLLPSDSKQQRLMDVIEELEDEFYDEKVSALVDNLSEYISNYFNTVRIPAPVWLQVIMHNILSRLTSITVKGEIHIRPRKRFHGRILAFLKYDPNEDTITVERRKFYTSSYENLIPISADLLSSLLTFILKSFDADTEQSIEEQFCDYYNNGEKIAVKKARTEPSILVFKSEENDRKFYMGMSRFFRETSFLNNPFSNPNSIIGNQLEHVVFIFSDKQKILDEDISALDAADTYILEISTDDARDVVADDGYNFLPIGYIQGVFHNNSFLPQLDDFKKSILKFLESNEDYTAQIGSLRDWGKLTQFYYSSEYDIPGSPMEKTLEEYKRIYREEFANWEFDNNLDSVAYEIKDLSVEKHQFFGFIKTEHHEELHTLLSSQSDTKLLSLLLQSKAIMYKKSGLLRAILTHTHNEEEFNIILDFLLGNRYSQRENKHTVLPHTIVDFIMKHSSLLSPHVDRIFKFITHQIGSAEVENNNLIRSLLRCMPFTKEQIIRICQVCISKDFYLLPTEILHNPHSYADLIETICEEETLFIVLLPQVIHAISQEKSGIEFHQYKSLLPNEIDFSPHLEKIITSLLAYRFKGDKLVCDAHNADYHELLIMVSDYLIFNKSLSVEKNFALARKIQELREKDID